MSRATGLRRPLARAVATYNGLPSIAGAAIEATIATMLFAAMSLLIRQASHELHALEIVFFRNFLAVAWMTPWLMRVGVRGLRTQRFGAYALRAGLGIVGMTAAFTSYTLIPLADATALTFTAPLFAAVIAALFLGEVIRIRRWTAIFVGFIGTMIVLRPGADAIQLGSLLALINAVTMAIGNLLIKSLSRTEPTERVVTYMVVLLTPLSLVPALFVWQWPTPMTLFWLFLLAGCGTAGHWCLTRSYIKADVSFIMPFDFLRLPFTALFAYLVFAEAPTIYTWIGGAVIFSSTFYIVMRERKLAREGRR